MSGLSKSELKKKVQEYKQQFNTAGKSKKELEDMVSKLGNQQPSQALPTQPRPMNQVLNRFGMKNV